MVSGNNIQDTDIAYNSLVVVYRGGNPQSITVEFKKTDYWS